MLTKLLQLSWKLCQFRLKVASLTIYFHTRYILTFHMKYTLKTFMNVNGETLITNSILLLFRLKYVMWFISLWLVFIIAVFMMTVVLWLLGLDVIPNVRILIDWQRGKWGLSRTSGLLVERYLATWEGVARSIGCQWRNTPVI